MSLIERAVARLANAGETPGATHRPAEAAVNGTAVNGAPAHGPAVEGTGVNGAVPDRTAFNGAGKPAIIGPPVEIDLERLRERGYATPSARATVTGREFRTIKSLILDKAFGRTGAALPNGKRVLVTSSRPGDGKTFCAISLAMSVAATGDQPVLLVDADIARPSLATVLGIQSGVGLMTWLKDEAPDPMQLVLPTNVAGLKVLCAGPPEAHAGELLAGSAMERVLERLTAAFPDHLVIIDAPPLLAVTETRSLARRAGQVVMVVAAGNTSRKTVDEALATLPPGCDTSLILNKLPRQSESASYYYSY